MADPVPQTTRCAACGGSGLGGIDRGGAGEDCRRCGGTGRTTQQLGGPAEVMIFRRVDSFYLVQGVLGVPLAQQAADHAALNPGTLRIEDTQGNVLWRLQ